jgi:hypothetical protein
MIPSGYKEDTVFSAIPTDGSGDLSFTRASNGTRVNSAGLVEVVAWNLFEYSEDFTNAYWSKSSSGAAAPVITANNTTAPNGTNTAEKVDLPALSGTQFSIISREPSIVGQTNASVYLKGVVGGEVIYLFWTPDGVNYVRTSCTLTTEWQRFDLTATIALNSGFGIGVDLRDSAQNDQSAQSFYIWGAQLNIGSTAKPYFPTTDRLNVPRLTYQNGGGGCPSLLLEKQSTNLVSYSEDFTNAVWPKENLTISANSTTSPDGTQNADSFIENSSNSSHQVYQGATVSAGAYTASVFMKKNTRQYGFLQIATDGAANRYTIVVDLDNGSVTATSTAGSPTGTSYKIDSMGNGWYRLTVTATHTSGEVYSVFGLSNSANPTFTSVATPIYTGNGTSGLYVWGAQVEASSYATSLIPTTSSFATRVADFDTSAGSSGNFGSLTPTGTKAVLYWELQFHSGSVTENINIGGFRNGTTNQYGMYYWGTNANKNFGFNSWAGDSYGITGANSLFDGQVHKIAGVFDFNNFTNNVLFIDGVKKTISQTLNTTLQRSANVVSLNSPDYEFQGNKCLLKEFLYFNQNLSDAELASLTTL